MVVTHTPASPWPSDRHWPLLFVGYFLAQALYRRALGGGLELDEAQSLLWAQGLAWGYGPQPPLYSWLQWAALQVVPDPLLALALLKNALLAATYLTVYALFRAAHPPAVAGTAALSLFLIPQISWDSQRDMSHSVLAVLLAALATHAFVTRTLAGRPGGWAAFGLLTGLGMLAKFNFALIPVSLLLAALSMPDFRSRITARGLALALALALAIVALPAHWAWQHPDLAFSSAGKLEAASGPGLLADLASGTREFAHALLKCLGIALVVFGILLYRRRRAPAPPVARPASDRLLIRAVLIGLAIAFALVLASRSTNVRHIWLLPLVYLSTPIATVTLAPRLGEPGLRLLRRIVYGLAAFVFVALGVRFLYGEPGNPSLSRAPIPEIVAAIEPTLPPGALIVAAPEWLAGNLIYRRPDLPVVSVADPGDPPAGPAVLLYWTDEPLDRILPRLSARWQVELAPGAPASFDAGFPLQPDERLTVVALPLHWR